MLKSLKVFLLATCFICVAVISIAYGRQQNKNWSEEEPVHVSIGINKSLKSAPVVISWKSGYFLKQGIKADLVMENSAVPLMKKLFAGKLDVICAPEHLVAFNALDRDDFRIIAVLNRNQSNELIINKDSGIHGIQQLKGARIGLKKKSSSFYFLYRLLLINGINLTDVHLVDISLSQMAASLTDKKVDAIIVWPPFTEYAKEKIGNKALSFNAHMGRDMYWVLVANKRWCKENTQTLERCLSALQSGFELIDKSPEKAMAISSTYFGFSDNRIKKEWGSYNFRMELPRGLILAMEQEAGWKIKQLKKNSPTPDFLELIEFRPLENLYPKKIDIIHK